MKTRILEIGNVLRARQLVGLVVLVVTVGRMQAQTTYTGPNGSYNTDTWNTDANWDSGVGTVPSGTIAVIIETGRIPWAVDLTPAYTGSLSLETNSVLGLGPTTANNTVNALGTGSITMSDGSKIIMRYSASYTFNQSILLTGDSAIWLSESSSGHNMTRTFASPISGDYIFTLFGQNGNIATLSVSNSFAGLVAEDGGSDNWKVVASAAGSLGQGSVTIGNTVNLVIGASGAMTNVTDLNLVDGRSAKIAGENKLVMNASDAVPLLAIDGWPYPTGTYGRLGCPTSVDNEVSWISGDGVLTVTSAPGDSIAPTVTNISDNAGGGPAIDASAVTYTVQFDEPMDASTITTNSFEDGGTSGAAISSVTMASPPISCTVVATPTTTGNLILQVKAGAVVKDLFGNPLDTGLAIQDDTVISVVAATAQNGTWGVDSDGGWGTAPNWQSGNVAYGTDRTATFPNILTANRTVTLGGDITIGNIDFQETGQDLTISGAQTLTLDVTSGAPQISVSNRTLNITSVVAGTNGLSKSGNGTLTLSGANTLTGDITIGGGTMTFNNLDAWGGSGKNVAFTADGTLTSNQDGYSGGVLNVGSATAIYKAAYASTFSSATGSGTLVFHTIGRNKILNIGDASALTGPLKLKYDGNRDYQGNTALQFSSLGDGDDSLLQFESGGSNSGQGVAIVFNGANPLTFNHRQIQFLPRTTSNWSLRDMILKNNSSSEKNSWVINTDLNNKSDRDHNFIFGGSNTNDNEFAGVIGDSTNGTYYLTQLGILSLEKIESGRWILSGENTYSGMTTVSGGTLVLKGEASIADSNTVNIISGTLEIETREAIRELQFGGTKQDDGIWGAVGNGMATYTDSRLTGAGLLYVNEPFPPTGTVLILR